MNFTVYQIKLTLLVFLGIYALLGFIIIAVSEVIKSNITSSIISNNLDMDSFTQIASIDISVHARWLLQSAFLPWGVVIVMLSFYGAFSVILEKRLLIKVFALLLVIVASMKVPVTSYSLYQTTTTEIATVYARNDMWSNFQKSKDEKGAAAARNFVQDWHSCCGVKDYTDYKIFNMPKIVYPKSCCYDDSQECYTSGDVKSDGCAEKVAISYLSAYRTISGMTIFVILLEIFGTIWSLYFPWLLLRRQLTLNKRGANTS